MKLECLTWNQINLNMILTESQTEPSHTDIRKYKWLRKRIMMVDWMKKIGISLPLNGLNIHFLRTEG